jgi:hypothetical protein
MRKYFMTMLIAVLPFSSFGKDVVSHYTFPDKAYTVTFPCIGYIANESSNEKAYDRFLANMTCDEKGVTYTVQYFKFHNLQGIKKASLQDKQYFLREFRDMVRKLYMGDYDDFLTQDETRTTVSGFPALQFDLVSEQSKYINRKIVGQAVLDQNNALYFSSIFVKSKENDYNIKEFFNSLKKGSK